MVVEGSISFRQRFQFVVEVDYDFGQRHVVIEFNAVSRDIFLLDQFAAFAQTERHDISDVVCSGDDGGSDVWFLNMINLRCLRHAGRIVHLLHLSVFVKDVVGNVGDRCDDVHVELTVKAFLNDFHVEQTEEATTETKAEGYGRLGLEC